MQGEVQRDSCRHPSSMLSAAALDVTARAMPRIRGWQRKYRRVSSGSFASWKWEKFDLGNVHLATSADLNHAGLTQLHQAGEDRVVSRASPSAAALPYMSGVVYHRTPVDKAEVY